MAKSLWRWLRSCLDKKAVVTGIILIVIGLAVTIPSSYTTAKIAQANTQRDMAESQERLDKIEQKVEQLTPANAVYQAEIENLKHQLDDLKKTEQQHHDQQVLLIQEQGRRTDRVIEILLSKTK